MTTLANWCQALGNAAANAGARHLVRAIRENPYRPKVRVLATATGAGLVLGGTALSVYGGKRLQRGGRR